MYTVFKIAMKLLLFQSGLKKFVEKDRYEFRSTQFKISISRYQIKHIPGTVKYFLQKLREFPASKWLLKYFILNGNF